MKACTARTALGLAEAPADRPAPLSLTGRLRPCDPAVAAEQFLALLTGRWKPGARLGTRNVPAARTAASRFDAGAMRHVAAPVLILNGEKDTVFRSGESDFARAHPYARVELIPRAGHLANFDDPGAFTDAVRRFAQQLPAPG